MLRALGRRRSSATPTVLAAVVVAIVLTALGVPDADAGTGPSAPSAMAAAEGITGTVSRTDGRRQLSFLMVTAVNDPHRERTYQTNDDGAFRISLAPGTYWVYFDGGPEVAREWWGGAITRGASTPVVVEAGSFTVLDPQLDPGGAISGVVPPLASADPDWYSGRVEVTTPDATYAGGRAVVGYGIVRDDGSYETTQLLTGEYRVRFVGHHRHLEGWWRADADPDHAATTEAAATPVAVTAPEVTTGIGATSLHRFGTVTGTVTRADGRPVAASVVLHRRAANGRWESWAGALTDSRGRYTIAAPADTYRVEARGERDVFFGGGSTVDRATSLPVVVAQDTTADLVIEPVAIELLTAHEIRGARRSGSTLSVTRASWYPAAVSERFQWLRGGRPIPGATGPRYTVRRADLNRWIEVRITARKPGYTSAVDHVEAVRINPGLLRLARPPAVRGRHRVGSVLRAIPPVVRPRASLRYQWHRNGYRIAGATGTSYRVRRGDREDFISVRIHAARPGYLPTWWETDRNWISGP